MGNVSNFNARRAQEAEDNRLLTPVDSLEDALSEVSSGERKCDKILIITLDTEDDGYGVGYYASNLSTSEQISLLEAMKAQCLSKMGLV